MKNPPTTTAGGVKPAGIFRVFAWLKRHWKLVTGTVMAMMWIQSQLGFATFMLEEGAQQTGFGTYALQEAKMWGEAHEAIMGQIVWAKRDRSFAHKAQYFNWLSGWAFVRYFDAHIQGLMWRLKAVESKMTDIEKRVAELETRRDLPMPSLDIKPIPAEPVQVAERPTNLPVGERIRAARQVGQPVAATSTTVYATQHGECFHRVNCPSIQGKTGLLRMTKDDAARQGLRQCRRCKP